MEPDRRHRPLSDIYHLALEKPAAERDAFLTEACEGDDALRREVESLLAYESVSSQFLERPAAVVAGAPGGPAMLNRQLGPYRIVAPLGAGGMGEVYRARDGKLGRDVAIKFLPPHFTADAERRARFAREARTLATLNHPHIGAIYGLEEADGASALVLELVEGPTLADRLGRGPLPFPTPSLSRGRSRPASRRPHEKGIVVCTGVRLQLDTRSLRSASRRACARPRLETRHRRPLPARAPPLLGRRTALTLASLRTLDMPCRRSTVKAIPLCANPAHA